MRTVLMLISTAALCWGLAPTAHAEPGALRVVAKGLRSNKGVVLCAAFASAKGFPKSAEAAAGRAMARISKGTATCVFDQLAPGGYAISFVHDEDGDGGLDTNFFGVPTEGYGFGNDARGSMGPPDFEAARIEYRGGDATVELETVY